jgi:predicted lipid-binding transport protein (Tim44 family)
MVFDNKRVISIALATALLGGTAGAFISRSGKSAETSAPQTSAAPATTAQTTTAPAATDQLAQNNPDAYREGFVDGVRTALDSSKTEEAANTVVERSSSQPARVVYRNARRGSNGATAARYDNSRRVYYDYEQPQKRSFWQKHRDKLTVAAGAGGGALIGGLLGGKKGAAIGALAGGGGSALYTYKIRKRNRNY